MDNYNPYPGAQAKPMKPMKVLIITGGGEMGYTLQALKRLQQEGLVELVTMDVSAPTGGKLLYGLLGEDASFMMLDEVMNSSVLDSPPMSPKRRALLSQLERAKMRRDKNMVRDLTRQLEKVW